MEKKKCKSIFDYYFSTYEKDKKLDWVPVSSEFKLIITDVVVEGNLKEEGESSEWYYVATSEKIIRFKRSEAFEECSQLELIMPHIRWITQSNSNIKGFSLTARGKVHVFYGKTRTDALRWFENLRQSSNVVSRHISRDYKIGKLIGRGSYAKVHTGTAYENRVDYAIKSVLKRRIMQSADLMRCLISEVSVLRKLDHPGINKLNSVYESESYVHLIIDLVRGGELVDRIQEKGTYTEVDAAKLMKKLLEVVQYFHSHGIIHRDLKLDNILLNDLNTDLQFKIVDFGFATVLKSSSTAHMICGSPGYTAPEVLRKQGYGCKADLFSCGVIMHILLTGSSPFHGSSVPEIIEKNRLGEVSFLGETWMKTSKDAMDLVRKLLEVDPENRISASEALQHKWFTQDYRIPVSLFSTLDKLRKMQDLASERQSPKYEETLEKLELYTSPQMMKSGALPPEEEEDYSLLTKEQEEELSPTMGRKISPYGSEEMEKDISQPFNPETKKRQWKSTNIIIPFSPGCPEIRIIPMSPGSKGVNKEQISRPLNSGIKLKLVPSFKDPKLKKEGKSSSPENKKEVRSGSDTVMSSKPVSLLTLQDESEHNFPESKESEDADKTPKYSELDATGIKEQLHF